MEKSNLKISVIGKKLTKRHVENIQNLVKVNHCEACVLKPNCEPAYQMVGTVDGTKLRVYKLCPMLKNGRVIEGIKYKVLAVREFDL